MIFFTSDTHFDHANIIKYCQRPFKDREEMNSVIIANWNRVVGPLDTVYHLGDVAFCGNLKANDILSALNGKIYHIKGNHDKKLKTDRFEWSKEDAVLDLFEEPDNGRSRLIYLRHEPVEAWPGMPEGDWHLHGHSHGNLPFEPGLNRVDVGVDCWDFKPVSLGQLQVKIWGGFADNAR